MPLALISLNATKNTNNKNTIILHQGMMQSKGNDRNATFAYLHGEKTNKHNVATLLRSDSYITYRYGNALVTLRRMGP